MLKLRIKRSRSHLTTYQGWTSFEKGSRCKSWQQKLCEDIRLTTILLFPWCNMNEYEVQESKQSKGFEWIWIDVNCWRNFSPQWNRWIDKSYKTYKNTTSVSECGYRGCLLFLRVISCYGLSYYNLMCQAGRIVVYGVLFFDMLFDGGEGGVAYAMLHFAGVLACGVGIDTDAR